MNWKKSVFSYLLWFVYAIAVGIGLVAVAVVWCKQLALQPEWGILAAAVCMLVTGIAVLLIHRFIGKKIEQTAQENRMVFLVLESILVVMFLSLGFVLRLGRVEYAGKVTENLVYLEAARVAEGQSIPQMVHGASYVYLQLLHGTFLVFGNKLTAAVWVQIALQFLVTMLLYFGVRRLAGKLAAVITVGYIMLSPYMIAEAVTLSPRVWYLVVYAGTLCCMGVMLSKEKNNLPNCVLCGILTGCCCYLDISGITLLAFVISSFLVERLETGALWSRRLLSFGVCVISTVLGWLGFLSWDALSCGKTLWNVLGAWAELYQPMSFQTFALFSGEIWLGELTVIFVLLAFGIFSFWCRRNYEKQTVWMGGILILTLLHSLQMLTAEMDGRAYVYLFGAVLAAVGVESVFARNKAESAFTGSHADGVAGAAGGADAAIVDSVMGAYAVAGAYAAADPEDGDALEILDLPKTVGSSMRKMEELEEKGSLASVEEPEGNASIESVEEPEENGSLETVEEPEENGSLEMAEMPPEKPKVKFLDNPLPLPKKHEPKVMDFKLTDVANDNDYDYAISDDDDFDIV